MRAGGPFREIFGRCKDFHSQWVGDPRLNRYGLHPARIALSDACVKARRLQLRCWPLAPSIDITQFRREGICVIPDFLPADSFRAVRDEAHAYLEGVARRVPHPGPRGQGFGTKLPFEGGFDRYDGGTLNRYLEIIPARTPHTWAAIRSPRLARTCSLASGFRHRPERFFLYHTVHGQEAENPDIQKRLHKDTFHSTVKLWLFLDDVPQEAGPFVYVPESHRMTVARYRWEYRRACSAATSTTGQSGGSFRVSDHELDALGLPPPRSYPVPANTLVLADVRGFHRRGDAAPGAERLSIYANLRLWPFAPVVY